MKKPEDDIWAFLSGRDGRRAAAPAVTLRPNARELWADGGYAWPPEGSVTPGAWAMTVVAAGADAVGGCCCTGPAHVAALRAAVDGRWRGGMSCRWAAARADEAGAGRGVGAVGALISKEALRRRRRRRSRGGGVWRKRGRPAAVQPSPQSAAAFIVDPTWMPSLDASAARRCFACWCRARAPEDAGEPRQKGE